MKMSIFLLKFDDLLKDIKTYQYVTQVVSTYTGE